MTGETFKYYIVEMDDGTIKKMTQEQFNAYLQEHAEKHRSKGIEVKE